MSPKDATRAPIDRAVLALAVAVFLAHVVASVAGPYEYFRDELYFIACGRHPAFGYVDQPPLVPLLAAATQLLGHSLFLLRALPAASHAASVVVAAKLAAVVANEANVDARVAARSTAIAIALAPMLLGLHTVLSTTAFELLAWTLVAYLAARAVLSGERRALVGIGLVTGLALEAKYAIPFFLAPLLAGLLFSRARSVLWTREAAIGAAIAAVVATPSFLWQCAHGFPFLELMHAASHGKNVLVSPVAFLENQVMVLSPALAPMWIGGAVWALVDRRLARVRFLAVAFVGVLALMAALHGKDYYAAPAYGVAFALGGAGVARVLPWLAARVAYFAVAGAVTAIAIPTCMPVLSPERLARYVVAMKMEEVPQENAQRGVVIPSLMADMTGWQRLETQVADVWRSLSDDERAHAVILTSNYGEAGAIDLYGASDGLPRAITGHNQYFLWGPELEHPRVVVRVNGTVDRWAPRCESLDVGARYDAPYAMPYEKDGLILVCRGMKPSLAALWPDFKEYE